MCVLDAKKTTYFAQWAVAYPDRKMVDGTVGCLE